MPELPEVETIALELRNRVLNETINGVQIFWERTVAPHTSKEFQKEIVGCAVASIARKGKYLLFDLTTKTLVVHLRMTGRFEISDKTDPPLPYERVRILFSSNLALSYIDPRKFGRLNLIQSSHPLLPKVGLDALSLDFTLPFFQNALKRKKSEIKRVLLDQCFVAGLGNIYVDESLWVAKIHPKTAAHKLSSQEVKALYIAIKDVLANAIKSKGTSLGKGKGNYRTLSGTSGSFQQKLNVYKQEKTPCSRCGTLIEKIIVSQRGTRFCPTCQIQKP